MVDDVDGEEEEEVVVVALGLKVMQMRKSHRGNESSLVEKPWMALPAKRPNSSDAG